MLILFLTVIIHFDLIFCGHEFDFVTSVKIDIKPISVRNLFWSTYISLYISTLCKAVSLSGVVLIKLDIWTMQSWVPINIREIKLKMTLVINFIHLTL